MLLTKINGKRIFNTNSEFLGTAKDVLIDPTEKAVKFLIKGDVESILHRDESEAKEFIKANFIPFSKVRAVKDIIVIGD